MTAPASTFPALTTPVFDGDTKLFGYTWQQQLIEWKRQIAAAALIAPSFGTGAPTAIGSEGKTYFDTTGSPYLGYVYHAGAWHAFS